MSEAKCTNCGEIKKLTDENFWRERRKLNGYNSICKVCQRIKSREVMRKRRANLETREIVNANNRRYYNTAKGKKQKKASSWVRNHKSRNADGYFTLEDIKARFDYYGNSCYYCKTPVEQTREGRLTIEHRIPISRGGTNWPSNLVPACVFCNSSKSSKKEKEYEKKRQR